jgi:DNA-binding NarL/FixJ family response regulator
MMEDAAPSLVLTELLLPRMNGVQFLKQIKDAARFKAIPAVILTSETDPGMKDTCMRLGCAAYLAKPVEPEVLYRTLQAVSESAPRANIRLNSSLKVIVGDSSVIGGSRRTVHYGHFRRRPLHQDALSAAAERAYAPSHFY